MTVPVILATLAITITFAGGIVSFMVLMWRIGRWQAKTEGRALLYLQEMNNITHRLDMINGNLAEAHARIDMHLEGHS